MQIQIDPKISQEIFKGIEQKGNILKEQLKELAEEGMESEINCAKFEIAYALSVSKKERLKTMKQLKEVRVGMWKDSLKKTKGNIKNAYAFYEERCDAIFEKIHQF